MLLVNAPNRRSKVCPDNTDSPSCTSTYSSDFQTLKICSWSGSACAEAASLSALNAPCYLNSGISTCVLCSSNADHSIFFYFHLFL